MTRQGGLSLRSTARTANTRWFRKTWAETNKEMREMINLSQILQVFQECKVKNFVHQGQYSPVLFEKKNKKTIVSCQRMKILK